jgi:hypothetical protein
VPDEWSDAPEDDAAGTAAPFGDEALDAQVRARIRASAEDARAQSAGRMAAAARAARLLHAEVAATNTSHPAPVTAPVPSPADPGQRADPEARADLDLTSDLPTSTAPEPGTSRATAPSTPVAPRSPEPAHPAWAAAADTVEPPADPLRLDPPGGHARPAPLRVPFGGPAAAIADAFSRPADQGEPMASGTPLAELRISGIGADLEQRGDQLLVYVDRLEHRDRLGRLRRRMPTSDVAHVEVHKRLTGATLVVQSVAGIDLVLRGARPEAAEAVRSTLLANLAPARRRGRPTPAPFDEAELLRKLVDLYRAGVLTGIELDAKTEVVARLAREATHASRSATQAAPTHAPPTHSAPPTPAPPTPAPPTPAPPTPAPPTAAPPTSGLAPAPAPVDTGPATAAQATAEVPHGAAASPGVPRTPVG